MLFTKNEVNIFVLIQVYKRIFLCSVRIIVIFSDELLIFGLDLQKWFLCHYYDTPQSDKKEKNMIV